MDSSLAPFMVWLELVVIITMAYRELDQDGGIILMVYF